MLLLPDELLNPPPPASMLPFHWLRKRGLQSTLIEEKTLCIAACEIENRTQCWDDNEIEKKYEISIFIYKIIRKC